MPSIFGAGGCGGGGEPPKADDRIGFFGQYGTHAEFMAKNREFAKTLQPPEGKEGKKDKKGR